MSHTGIGLREEPLYKGTHQQNVKTTPGPSRGVMVPLVLLVHIDPPWSTFSVKFEKVWIRMDRSGPGGPRGPQPPLVDQERSGPPWTTLRHFPEALGTWDLGSSRNHLSSFILYTFNTKIFIYHAFGNQDTTVLYEPSDRRC